jgi:Leucine-rich repeat (LRR) protein
MNTGLSDVVLEISKIKFSCLKQLDLSSNKITNIEGLCFLRIPNIKNIILRNNFIVNISPLKKGKWKNLELLDLECNLFVEWGRINELYIDLQSI